jgi:general secretion pathway protein D
MNKTNAGLGRHIAHLALVAVLLGGCAGQQAHRDGLTLMAEGRAEEGLAKLTEATQAAPGNLKYRADLISNREQTVNRLLVSANSERAAGRQSAAQALYTRVLGIDPDNSRARLGLEAVEMDKRHDVALAEAEKALKRNDLAGARAALKPVLLENPRNGKAVLLQQQVEEREAKQRLAEPTLRAQFNKPVTLQFRDANLKMVFEALSRTSGINVLLDKDVRPDLKTSIFVKDVSVEDTIDLILMQNQLEKKVISDNTVFIYPSTPAKLKDYQDLKIRSFHLVHADPKQILTMLKTLLKTKDIFIHEKTNSIVMRDTPDAIRLAEKMVADQDVEAPEVMLEVEVLEVNRTHLSDLGIEWPNSFSVKTPDSVDTLGELKHFNANDLLVSPLSATLKLQLERGDTNLLASPRIRVRNREKAKIMVGDRVPVITNSVTPISTGGSVVTGSVQYLDVGLKLEVEPDILPNNEVVIKLGMDVSSISRRIPGPEGSLAYEVGTRNASTVLRLKDGETQILGGLISDEDRKSSIEVPGLGQIPILGYLFSSHLTDKKKTEIVLSITPHIVGSTTLPDADDVEYWAGTESSLRSTPFNLKPLGTVAVSTSAAAAPVARVLPPQAARRDVPPQAAPAAGPVVLSWQGPSQAKVGQLVSLTLNAQSAQALGRMEMQVNFDPAVWKAVDVTEGSFLKQNNMQSSFVKTIDQPGGQIQLDVTGTGAGASGSGSVATLVFEALAADPQAAISVGRMTPTAPGGEEVAATVPEPHVIAVAP